MRRMITSAVASSLLALALPVAASAHDSARHDAFRHAGEHHRHHHHRRAHTVVFTAGAVRTVPGTTAPVAPVTPVPAEPAATIASFENGVLKLTLGDGSTVAGKVTERTEIECRMGDREDFGDDNGRDRNDNDNNGDGRGRGGPGPSGSGDNHGDDERGGDAGQMEGQCGVSSLVPGAKVADADLAVTSAGSFWERVELAS
jgi:hypothetical protein